MSNGTILCVDDEQMILVSLEQQLHRYFNHEYDVEVAESGEEALEIIEELLDEGQDIPVIITDQIMPGMKGDELLKVVHEILPRTLKILLTGQADAGAVGRAVNEARLYRYIAKPWEQTDLNLTVSEAIRSYFQDKQLAEQNQLLQKANLELAALNTAYERFVPRQFLSHLGKESITEVELGDSVQREMTVLFSDIRDFTRMSESMSPTENFKFVNAYLSRMEPTINQYGGFIDKYIGDAIMALFATDADLALQCAIQMLRCLHEYNKTRGTPNREKIRIGIGLHTGMLMLGTVGGPNRMDSTVISDAVNLAARMEQLTKTFEASLLITDATYQRLTQPEQYHLQPIERVMVKGKSAAVQVYKVMISYVDRVEVS